jgi:prolipoprotein diacylglyceryltransferase
MDALLLPRPILGYISLGGDAFPVTAHAALFITGVLVALAYVIVTERRRYDWLWLTEMVVYGFIAGLFGARLAFLMVYPSTWMTWLDAVAIWQGGLISFGGIIAGVACVMLRTRTIALQQRHLLWARLAVATCFAWAVGRLGNYYGLESSGIESSVWQVTYGLVPVALFEALGCLVVGIVLHSVLSRALRPPLQILILALLSYLSVRFAVDFWRDERVVAGLRISQWVSFCGILVCASLFRHQATHDRASS